MDLVPVVGSAVGAGRYRWMAQDSPLTTPTAGTRPAEAPGHERGATVLPQLHPDLLGVQGFARVVAVRPGRERPHRAGVGGGHDPVPAGRQLVVADLGDQPVEAAPEPAHAQRRRLEVHHRDGQPLLDRVRPAQLRPVEPVDLHQPPRPVPDRHPFQLLHRRLVLAERGGDVAEPVRGPDPEVAQLRDRLGLGDLRVDAPHRHAVGRAPVDLVSGLARPVGVGADQADPVARVPAPRQLVPAPVRLPAAHRGQAGVGGVALGDAVAQDRDLADDLLAGLAAERGRDLLAPARLGQGRGELRAVELDARLGGYRSPALAEPAQVERGARVVDGRRVGGVGRPRRDVRGEPAPRRRVLVAVLALAVPGQVVRRLVPVDPPGVGASCGAARAGGRVILGRAHHGLLRSGR